MATSLGKLFRSYSIMGKPVPPSDCNCHCDGGEIRYDCIAGCCRPSINGPYLESTCSGICPPCQRYECINGCCKASPYGRFFDPSCSGICPPCKYKCTETGNCVEDPDGIYFNSACDNECTPLPSGEFWTCVIDAGFCIQDPYGQYETEQECIDNCDVFPPLNCCEWGGADASIVIYCEGGGTFTEEIDCQRESDYVWRCQGTFTCGDSYDITITCNAGVVLEDPSDCEEKWTIEASIPCVENLQVVGQCGPCACNQPPQWCFSGDTSDCGCCDDQICACCIPGSPPTCIMATAEICSHLGGTQICPFTCSSFPNPCSDLDGGGTGSCCATQECFDEESGLNILYSACLGDGIDEQACASMGGIWTEGVSCQENGCLSTPPCGGGGGDDGGNDGGGGGGGGPL